MFKKLGFVVAVVSMTACGGSTDSGSVACVVGAGSASQTCIASKDLTGQANSAFRSSCTGQEHGTIASACPTANLVGCCTIESNGATAESCFYEGTASDLMSACAQGNGTWSTTL